jgi:hypothetical protein
MTWPALTIDQEATRYLAAVDAFTDAGSDPFEATRSVAFVRREAEAKRATWPTWAAETAREAARFAGELAELSTRVENPPC